MNKMMMLCSAKLTSLLVANLPILLGTGSFLMELELPELKTNRISTEPEVRWCYI